MNTKVVFEKMHGIGNDFVLIDLRNNIVDLTTKTIQKLADRNKGIGFDQLLLVDNSVEVGCDASYRFFNPDGSEAEQCGNGQRCISHYLHNLNPEQSSFEVSGLAGNIQSTIVGNNSVKVKMGKVKRIKKVRHGGVDCFEVNFGNPHLICQINKVASQNLAVLNQKLTQAYTKGINLEIVQVNNRQEIKLRVYERGTGETLACGSGACACVHALIQNNQLDDIVKVILPGGTLMVEYDQTDQNLYLTGSAKHIFTGEITL